MYYKALKTAWLNWLKIRPFWEICFMERDIRILGEICSMERDIRIFLFTVQAVHKVLKWRQSDRTIQFSTSVEL